MYPVRYDELHVVSDLHLGGEPGRQIFKGADILAALIESLRAQPVERRIALVINGDFVDFLAEPDAKAFDPNGAVAKLRRIRNDPVLKPVFDALAAFVARPGRELVVVLGNHDLELALPDLREELVGLLGGSDGATAGRIRFSLEGAGFVAEVGGARVLCVHGNDVDGWNATDYEYLRRLARDRQFGEIVPAWTPNAGSKMVIDVMNGIKRNLPFVDLLKPETEAVVPLLLALDQAGAGKLREAAGVASKYVWDGVRRTFGFLNEDDPSRNPVEASAASRAARPPGGDPLAAIVRDRAAKISASATTGSSLLKAVEERLVKGVDPLSLLQGEAGVLGVGDAIFGWIRGRSKAEIVREALESLHKDRSFDPTAEDDTFRLIDEQASSAFDYVVAGHTHLERVLKRKRGVGTYFNTGTWARLIRIRPEDLADEATFAPVFHSLQATTIADLDRTPGLVTHRATVASIRNDGAGGAKAGLFHASLAGGTLSFSPVSAEGVL